MNRISTKESQWNFEAQLGEINRAALAGAPNAAFVLAWGVTESALEKATGESGLPPSLLISYAFRRRIVDQAGYSMLIDSMQKRNEIAHGARQATSEEVAFLTQFILRISMDSEKQLSETTMQSVSENIDGELYEYFPLGEFIVRAPSVCRGRPTFKYTRIEVEGALQRLASGEAFAAVVLGYNGRVSKEALQEAIDITARPLLDELPDLVAI